mmetsp:Transcript_41224/g.87706  ORF Transcript_41224/g.87706 Transcript_41224/m.87706 type:complete len:314 (-) Transcript_41224:458-1399(-)
MHAQLSSQLKRPSWGSGGQSQAVPFAVNDLPELPVRRQEILEPDLRRVSDLLPCHLPPALLWTSTSSSESSEASSFPSHQGRPLLPVLPVPVRVNVVKAEFARLGRAHTDGPGQLPLPHGRLPAAAVLHQVRKAPLQAPSRHRRRCRSCRRCRRRQQSVLPALLVTQVLDAEAAGVVVLVLVRVPGLLPGPAAADGDGPAGLLAGAVGGGVRGLGRLLSDLVLHHEELAVVVRDVGVCAGQAQRREVPFEEAALPPPAQHRGEAVGRLGLAARAVGPLSQRRGVQRRAEDPEGENSLPPLGRQVRQGVVHQVL